MAVRVRMFSILAAVLVVAAVVSAGSARAVTVYPTLYVNYTDNCTFTIVNDQGSPVSTIPPGTYEVEVTTPIMYKLIADQGIPNGSMEACGIGWVQFQLTGPGVNMYTTLTVGCDASDSFPAVYFAPSSTFVAQDNAQPSVTHTTLTTLATGSPTAPTLSASNLASKSTSSGGSLSALGTPISGTKATTAGSLTGSVSAKGAVTLTYKSKALASLNAGSYKITVTDKSKKTGLMIGQVGHRATTLSGIGKHTATLALNAGQWFFAPTGGGKKLYFFVTTS
jgi:hypothetical protein